MTQPKEGPILFSTAMVDAILSGRKTETRRVVKPQPRHEENAFDWDLYRWSHPKATGGEFLGNDPAIASRMIECSPYVAGNRLWVRETWRMWSWENIHELPWVQFRDGEVMECRFQFRDYWTHTEEDWSVRMAKQSIADCERAGIKPDPETGLYCADDDEALPTRWRPSIHMPRWASRITLEITNVRVERLQEIEIDGVYAEGTPAEYLAGYEDCRLGFRDLWDSINAARGFPWHSNPWVWVIQFKVIDHAELEANAAKRNILFAK